eukprot:COSAG02_NODE_926_length_15856_cov_13.975566_23_plen_524_part_00
MMRDPGVQVGYPGVQVGSRAVIAAEPAPWYLHQGEHEVKLVSTDGHTPSVKIHVTNCNTGDVFERSWNTAACAQEVDLPAAAREPLNFHCLVQAALQCEAAGSGATSELGSGSSLTCRSFEEGMLQLSAPDDQKYYMVTMQLKIGDGMLALRHDINLKIPMVHRATELERHQVSSTNQIHRLQQTMLGDRAAAESQLQSERSQHRRSMAAALGCVSIIAIAIATISLSEERMPGGDDTAHLATGCFLSDLRHLNDLVVLKPTVVSRVAEVMTTAFGALLLRYGVHMLPAVLFFSGFIGSAILCFMFAWSLFYHIQWFECSVLAGATICGGLLGGFLARVFRTAAFAVLGSLAGAVLGYYAYILVMGHLVAGPLTFWVSVIVPAVLGGGVVLRRADEAEAVAATSSVVGSCLVVVSLALLFLPPDASQWLKLQHGLLHPDLKPVGDWFHVLGPVVLALFLAAWGTSVQLHARAKTESAPESAPIVSDLQTSQGYGACVPVEAVSAISVDERQPLIATAPALNVV